MNGIFSHFFSENNSFVAIFLYMMAKKKSSISSRGKPSKNFKQKRNKKGGRTTPQNFRRKKARDKETDEFDEVSEYV